ncbi:PKD domain-containing protein [Streptosporangium subroseum]|nr:PKD domain-containing protein [Streptosporangium subroseum]
MTRKARRFLLVFVTLAMAVTGVTVTPQVANAGTYGQKPEVTCTSEAHPQFASDMADFMRIAINVGTVVRYDGSHEPGIAFYDYVTRTECYSTTDTSFKTASLVKASILGALLYRPQEISDAERPLVEKMILESDNDTALTLWKESLGCGKDEAGNVRPCTLYRDFLEAAGMDGTYPDDGGAFGDTYTTARDQIRLFKVLTSPNELIGADRRTYAMDLLERAEPRYGVTSFAPPNTRQRLKVGFSKLGDDDDHWRVNAAGQVQGGSQGYNYLASVLTDRNEEFPTPGPFEWPFNGIERVDAIAEQINCGARELNGDNSCWDFKSEDCYISSPKMDCRTDHPLRSHRSQHWVRVSIGAKLGSTVHWKLMDAANGSVVHEGDAVGGPSCVCEKTVYGLYGSYILLLNTNVANGGDNGTISNHTGGPQDPDPNQPPVVNAGPDLEGDEGSPISVAGFANDDDGFPRVQWTARPGDGVDPGGSCTFANPNTLHTTVTCNDDGTFAITLSANDGVNAAVHDEALVRVRNVAPTIGSSPGQRSAETAGTRRDEAAVAKSIEGGIETPRPWQVFRVGDPVPLTATFTDPGSNDTHTCSIAWDDGTTASPAADGLACRATHTFAHPGMYTIKTRVTDDDTGSGLTEVMVIVYDPDAGFATAGGHLPSPAGALTANPSATGKGHFQFNPKYHPHDEGPAPRNGKVQFRIDGVPFDLSSAELQWLVVAPDDKIAVKGTANVGGKDGYGFVAYAYDADPDRFRLVVWPLSAGDYPTSTLTYDNSRHAGYDLDVAQPQQIGNGSIQAHN